jgi:hypothetical protein
MSRNIPTRFPKGINNVERDAPLGMFGMPVPYSWHQWFTDFNTYTAADWVVSETDAGATEALTAGDGGLLLITNTAADNDLVSIQGSVANFLMEAGKKAFFSVRFKASEATQIDWICGLYNVQASPIGTPPTDGIYFRKDDGDTNIDISVRKDATTGANNQNAVGTFAADTFIQLDWYYDGVALAAFFIDGNLVYQLDASSTYLPDATLALSFCIQNGDANARNATIDWVFAAKER